ncbi:DUF6702 family protein [Rheinheimera aquimaris]|jgi:hypothetical protein|uniref:DUF6702 family protein n=1 Tax=Rheinheimera aquimaris TaxID=412437 RepID=UPI001F0FF5EE|nr:DUF6702 family protein [Rheinheimera aquimaris]|tara:strand:- start:1731 stop:2228 length:498 start_codon:yes stop_codon:yes gene_type:complete
MRLLPAIVMMLSVLAGNGQALAHEMKTALTRVLFNTRSGNLEVMHRFYVHDAEHGVKELFDKSADLLNSEQTQQTFSQYVSEHFALQTLGGEVLPLTLLGGQLDGRFFWVYQEMPLPDELKGLRIKQDALQAIWPSQINVVNVEGRGRIQSLTFDNQTTWQQLQF